MKHRHRISCATDEAAWRTPKIRMQRFAFECGFLFAFEIRIFFDSPSTNGNTQHIVTFSGIFITYSVFISFT